jgi:hypothetical protein
MTHATKKIGRFAHAWLMHCDGEVSGCSSSGPVIPDETVFIDRRPTPPVEFATETIIGWHLDPRWLE